MRYQVLRDCHGFKGAYWEKGQIVELSNDEQVPVHFEALEKVAPKKAEPVSDPAADEPPPPNVESPAESTDVDAQVQAPGPKGKGRKPRGQAAS